jgi:glycosyltransferase involved in cell wall biosynthesis
MNHINSVIDNKVLVSVCVPTYNQENELKDALDGILAQDYHHIEIIIANDGSTDGTGKVCEHYLKMYPDKIRYINQPQNQGIIQNSKDCLLAAKGKYIAVCEGDDYWISKDKLSKQVQILEDNSDISMVHTGWIDFKTEIGTFTKVGNGKGSLLPESNEGLNSFLTVLDDKYRGIRFSSVLFRTDVFHLALSNHKEFFSPNFSTIDIGIFYIMSYYGKLGYLDEATTVYRIHDGSVSVNKNVERAVRFSLGVLAIKAYFCREFEAPGIYMDKYFRHAFQGVSPYILQASDKVMANEVRSLAKRYGYNLRIGQRLCMLGARNKYVRWLLCRLIG